MTDDCIFCSIVGRRRPAAIVYQDEAVTAFRDLNPKAPVHVLLVPNRHIAGASQMVPEDAETVGRLFLAAKQVAATEGLEAGGYRLVVNSGADAGQSVFHLHLHLLGGRRMGWPPG